MHVVESSKEYKDCGECQSCRSELVHARSLAHATFVEACSSQSQTLCPSQFSLLALHFQFHSSSGSSMALLHPNTLGTAKVAVVTATVSCKHASHPEWGGLRCGQIRAPTKCEVNRHRTLREGVYDTGSTAVASRLTRLRCDRLMRNRVEDRDQPALALRRGFET